MQAKIRKHEARWLPALESLIAHVNNGFSASFDRGYGAVLNLTTGIGCVGEVRLSRDDDYEKWGIDILVKFRDTEQLQLLTGQRQSGGVRYSLGTALTTRRNARSRRSSTY